MYLEPFSHGHNQDAMYSLGSDTYKSEILPG